VPEVDDDQLAALRRLRAAFGFVEVVEAVSHDPEDDLAAAPHESIEGARMADPGRMSPEEQEQAHALLTRALSDVDIHPLPVAGLAAVVVDKLGFVTEPDRAPIAGEHAVGTAKWFERLVATLVLSEDAVSVRGMEAGLPEIRGIAVLGGVSQAGLDLWALADPGAADAVVLDVGVAGICPVPESPVLGSTSVTSPLICELLMVRIEGSPMSEGDSSDPLTLS